MSEEFNKIEIKDQLLEKSKESFLMAIEVYNKPSIKYRLEGFSFFICNAWELLMFTILDLLKNIFISKKMKGFVINTRCLHNQNTAIQYRLLILYTMN